MNNLLKNFIEKNKPLLEKGEVLSILLLDGYVTIYNEVVEESESKSKSKLKQRTITLVDTCDTHFDCEISELIEV